MKLNLKKGALSLSPGAQSLLLLLSLAYVSFFLIIAGMLVTGILSAEILLLRLTALRQSLYLSLVLTCGGTLLADLEEKRK